jgi:hypothetical protein
MNKKSLVDKIVENCNVKILICSYCGANECDIELVEYKSIYGFFSQYVCKLCGSSCSKRLWE